MQVLPITDIARITNSQSGEKRKTTDTPKIQSRKKGKTPANKPKTNLDISMDL
jgi:hypothetical protein